MKNLKSRIKKIETILDRHVVPAKIASIPRSWIRYEDHSTRALDVVRAYEQKYNVKVETVFCIPTFKPEDDVIYHEKDADFYFPDEDKELMKTKPARIYSFILRNN